MGSIPGLERSPRVVNGNTLQYSCLGNPMDRGAWWAADHRVTKGCTQLSTYALLHLPFQFSDFDFLWLFAYFHSDRPFI